MTICYCVVCHKFTPVLEELVRQMGAGNEVLMHVDAKADIAAFEPLRGRVRMLENRVDVRWGHYSQIEATLRLLQASRAVDCDYVSLVSGDTLPLLADGELKRRIIPGREYMVLEPVLDAHRERVGRRFPAMPRGRVGRTAFGLARRLGLFHVNRFLGALPPLGFGSNWFMITPQFREYILHFVVENPDYVRAFAHSLCGDEIFFATIAVNSPFAERLADRSYFYVDWRTGPQFPRTLDASDFDRLRAAMDANPSLLLARKFADDLDLRRYRDDFLI